MVCGITLYFNVAALPRLIAIALILIIASCFAREGLSLLVDAKRRLKAFEYREPESDDAASDDDSAAQQSSTETTPEGIVSE